MVISFTKSRKKTLISYAFNPINAWMFLMFSSLPTQKTSKDGKQFGSEITMSQNMMKLCIIVE